MGFMIEMKNFKTFVKLQQKDTTEYEGEAAPERCNFKIDIKNVSATEDKDLEYLPETARSVEGIQPKYRIVPI